MSFPYEREKFDKDHEHLHFNEEELNFLYEINSLTWRRFNEDIDDDGIANGIIDALRNYVRLYNTGE